MMCSIVGALCAAIMVNVSRILLWSNKYHLRPSARKYNANYIHRHLQSSYNLQTVDLAFHMCSAQELVRPSHIARLANIQTAQGVSA